MEFLDLGNIKKTNTYIYFLDKKDSFKKERERETHKRVGDEGSYVEEDGEGSAKGIDGRDFS